jgi:hypothetical protein
VGLRTVTLVFGICEGFCLLRVESAYFGEKKVERENTEIGRPLGVLFVKRANFNY